MVEKFFHSKIQHSSENEIWTSLYEKRLSSLGVSHVLSLIRALGSGNGVSRLDASAHQDEVLCCPGSWLARQTDDLEPAC
jgi:hypothetical protein